MVSSLARAFIILLPALVACESPSSRFPYREVVVFVDADSAATPTILRRLQYVNEIGEFYNRRYRGRFDLTIVPIGTRTQTARPLFHGRRRSYNDEGTFFPHVFRQQYLRAAVSTHDRDVLGTIPLVETHIANNPRERSLVIYISDMVHVTREVDTSWEGTGEINYDQFKEEYEELAGRNGALGGGRVDVIIRDVGRSHRADPELAQFWGAQVLHRHLGVRKVWYAGMQGVSELMEAAH